MMHKKNLPSHGIDRNSFPHCIIGSQERVSFKFLVLKSGKDCIYKLLKKSLYPHPVCFVSK